ncbi:hypothetical protein JY651_30055 [Pyxidicoccus parkwayensis]|uniref:Lipoprotein n=1 Tax=Pyxidicoccus parkwayensis TaxID=2813578 RepID=A0ABX7NL13_9BACT|nr:hypothetical protein [Pyxidicoccus parkwaysis]QSQ19545.1 hypothetical protein JY651_30055 [Pyxidicoccus parkwaysis]
MNARTFTASLLLAAALGGCSDAEPGGFTPGPDAPLVELPAAHASVSGFVFDPEAFLVQVLSAPPPDPEQEGPGEDPAIFDGTSFLVYSAIPSARVRLAAPGLPEATSGEPLPTGHWQVDGVTVDDTTPYYAEALPPSGPVTFDNPDAYFPVPSATYYPTTYLRPIQVNVTQCMSQTALMVGNAGALDAVAQHLTAQGTPTTVADLMDPAKTGGVVLLFVHMPSFFYDFFLSPMDSVAGETSAGTLMALDWAAPSGAPGQSPMGFSVLPDPVSMVGYFALVLPPGVTEPVTVSFTDTYVPGPEEEPGPAGPRPLMIPPTVIEPSPGVSVQRVFAIPNFGEEPPPDPLDDPLPPFPADTWICMPMPSEEPPPEG